MAAAVLPLAIVEDVGLDFYGPVEGQALQFLRLIRVVLEGLQAFEKLFGSEIGEVGNGLEFPEILPRVTRRFT